MLKSQAEIHSVMPNREWEFLNRVLKYKGGLYYGEVNEDEEPNGYGFIFKDNYVGEYYKLHGGSYSYGRTIKPAGIEYHGFNNNGFYGF